MKYTVQIDIESAFPKQSMAFLLAFKSFAENGTDVRAGG